MKKSKQQVKKKPVVKKTVEQQTDSALLELVRQKDSLTTIFLAGAGAVALGLFLALMAR